MTQEMWDTRCAANVVQAAVRPLACAARPFPAPRPSPLTPQAGEDPGLFRARHHRPADPHRGRRARRAHLRRQRRRPRRRREEGRAGAWGRAGVVVVGVRVERGGLPCRRGAAWRWGLTRRPVPPPPCRSAAPSDAWHAAPAAGMSGAARRAPPPQPPRSCVCDAAPPVCTPHPPVSVRCNPTATSWSGGGGGGGGAGDV